MDMDSDAWPLDFRYSIFFFAFARSIETDLRIEGLMIALWRSALPTVIPSSTSRSSVDVSGSACSALEPDDQLPRLALDSETILLSSSGGRMCSTTTGPLPPSTEGRVPYSVERFVEYGSSIARKDSAVMPFRRSLLSAASGRGESGVPG